MRKLAINVFTVLMICMIFLTACGSSNSSKKITTWSNVNQKFIELEQAESETKEFIKMVREPTLPTKINR